MSDIPKAKDMGFGSIPFLGPIHRYLMGESGVFYKLMMVGCENLDDRGRPIGPIWHVNVYPSFEAESGKTLCHFRFTEAGVQGTAPGLLDEYESAEVISAAIEEIGHAFGLSDEAVTNSKVEIEYARDYRSGKFTAPNLTAI